MAMVRTARVMMNRSIVQSPERWSDGCVNTGGGAVTGRSVWAGGGSRRRDSGDNGGAGGLSAGFARTHHAFITRWMSGSIPRLADRRVSHDTPKNTSSEATSANAETEMPAGRP